MRERLKTTQPAIAMAQNEILTPDGDKMNRTVQTKPDLQGKKKHVGPSRQSDVCFTPHPYLSDFSFMLWSLNQILVF